MKMPYQISRLSPDLVLIRWYTTPAPPVEEQFLKELQALLDQAPHPFYLLSDLRRGRIIGMFAISQLGSLTHHPNWAGSTAFSRDVMSKIFVSNFRSFSRGKASVNEMHNTVEEALGFLESLKPGISAGIDWDAVLENEDSQQSGGSAG